MTAEATAAAPGSDENPGPPVNAYRPVGPTSGPTRWLRSLTGVQEDILRWVPEERGRYTRLGAIVLNTGLLATLSMLAALVKFLNVQWYALLPIALLWGWLIVWIDSWLITSTHGVGNNAVGGVFMVRLALALVIGLVIAEPLLLKVFEPAINRQVRTDRSDERRAKESDLKACNPVPYHQLDGATFARCRAGRLLLSTPDSPAAANAALAQVEHRQTTVGDQIKKATTQIKNAEDMVRRECVGQHGPGLTGQRGDGPYCERAKQVAEQVRTDSKIAQYQRDAQDLERSAASLTTQSASAEQRYEQQVDKAIAAKLPPITGKIGILEQDRALGRLSSQSHFVLIGQWLLRLLLVMVDCLPILAKRLSGTTTYDQMLSRQLATDEDLHSFDDDLKRQLHLAEKRVALKESEVGERRRLEELEEREHAAHSQREAEIDARIDARAEELRRRFRAGRS